MMQNFDSKIIEDIFFIDSENIHENQIVQQCFDIVGVFVAAIDLKGNITLINKKGKEILGYNENRIVGENFIEQFIVPKKQNATEDLFTSAIKGKQRYPESIRYHLLTNNKKLKIIEANNIIIRDKNNNIVGILISGEDITRYVKNQHNLQKDISLYRILANNIPDINLFMFDRELQFILAEGNEMKNNGFAREDFEGKKLSEIPGKQIKRIWEPLFRSALTGEEISSEYKYNNYFYLIWVIPIRNSADDIYSVVAITQNITDDKLTEQKLKKSKDEAEKASQAKSDFLARVSHEIRTPLNAILGFTEQLKQTELNDKQTNFINIIDKSSEHLLSLINDILILSKIEARQISLDNSPFKIEQTIKYVYNTLKDKADEKGIQFNYIFDKNLDQVLLGDSFRLRQILINMLSNAIKFTDKGYVELNCFISEETKDEIKVRFDIIDTGIGIRSENLETIFEQFKQADSGITKKYGGTGLGLTICKNLINLQNGILTVNSQINIGTTFTFIIPYKKGLDKQVIEEDSVSIDTKILEGKNILLVDDDSVNRLLSKTILEKFNCSYDIAINGNEAINKLNSVDYDLILLDIHMPDISGIDVAKYVRFKKKNQSTKIIAVTAGFMQDDIKRCYQTGINDFLIKPFKEIHLFKKMCDVLNINTPSYKIPKEEMILKKEVNVKPYDLQELKIMTDNNKAAISEMLNTFIENSEIAIRTFNQSLKNEDWKQIGETAHKVLPSYRHLKVNSLITNLTNIKTKALIDKDYDSINNLVGKSIKEMDKTVEMLKEELNNFR